MKLTHDEQMACEVLLPDEVDKACAFQDADNRVHVFGRCYCSCANMDTFSFVQNYYADSDLIRQTDGKGFIEENSWELYKHRTNSSRWRKNWRKILANGVNRCKCWTLFKTKLPTRAKSKLRGEIFGALSFQRKPSDCNGCGISPKLKRTRKTAGQTRPVGEILEILEILQGMKCAISGRDMTRKGD